MEQTNKSSIGSIIGIIIIITIIILGGLYFWGKRIEEARYKEKIISESQNQTETVQVSESASIKTVSPGDDTSTIEADLNSTNLNNLDAELNQSIQ
jgi:uncharacterized protein YdgA (DUF945 family)